MQFFKHIAREMKAGYTLVEVLVVVSIMGILSSMGVAGLQSAIANARVKDAAVNTAAFLERVANEARQLSAPICLKISNDSTTLYAIKTAGSDCSASNKTGSVVDSLIVDSPVRFSENKSQSCNVQSVDMTTSSNAIFRPRMGLSAVPPEGVVCVKYGNADRYGVAQKSKTSNSVKAMWKVGNESGDEGWQEL